MLETSGLHSQHLTYPSTHSPTRPPRRCYLVQRMRQESLGQATITFNKWVEDRKELGHLLHHVTLDT